MIKVIGNIYKGDLHEFDISLDTNNNMIIFEGKDLELSIQTLRELLESAEAEL